MSESKPIHIISFVGLAGSGKSSAVEYLTRKNYPKVEFGSVVKNAVADAGLPLTPKNETMMRSQLRKESGEDVDVNHVIEQINGLAQAGQRVIVADGLSSWRSHRILKHAFPGEVTTIALLTSHHVRHHRLANRPERPMTEQEVTDRDIDDIERLNKGGVIAMANYFVTNDGTIDELYDAIDTTVSTITR